MFTPAIVCCAPSCLLVSALPPPNNLLPNRLAAIIAAVIIPPLPPIPLIPPLPMPPRGTPAPRLPPPAIEFNPSIPTIPLIISGNSKPTAALVACNVPPKSPSPASFNAKAPDNNAKFLRPSNNAAVLNRFVFSKSSFNIFVSCL